MRTVTSRATRTTRQRNTTTRNDYPTAQHNIANQPTGTVDNPQNQPQKRDTNMFGESDEPWESPLGGIDTVGDDEAKGE